MDPRTLPTRNAAYLFGLSHGGDQLRRCVTGVIVGAFFLFALVAGCTAAEPDSPTGIVSRIRREPVESRAIAAVGYSRRLRALEVEFKRGGTYRYLDVPSAVHRELLAAESKAGFYNRFVKGKYKSLFVRARRKR